MEKIRANERLLLTLAAVLVCVFLFACGAPPPESARSTEPAPEPAVSPSSASLSAPRPAAPAPAPGVTPSDRIAGDEAEGEVTFGASAGDGSSDLDDEPVREPAPSVHETPLAGRVFTNKDLGRYRRVKEEFGFEEGKVIVDLSRPAAGESPQAAVEGRESRATDEELEKEDRETRQKISALSAEAEYLRKRIPSLHNPLLPRATPSDADKVAEAGMDNAQRLERVTSRLTEVESELNALQRRLADLYQKRSAGPDAINP